MTAQRNWASEAIFPAHKAHVRTEILEAHYAATAPPPHLTRTSPFPFPQPTKTHHPIPLSSSLSSPLPASHCNPNPPQSPTPLPPPWARPTPTPSKSPATLLSPSSCGLGRWKRGPICLRFFFFFVSAAAAVVSDARGSLRRCRFKAAGKRKKAGGAGKPKRGLTPFFAFL